MQEQLTTNQVTELLKVSKRTVLRYAVKHEWNKTTTTDGQGRIVTLYDMADILKSHPAVGADVNPDECLHADVVETPDVQDESPSLTAMTTTIDPHVIDALQDAIISLEGQNRANNRHISTVQALCVILLAVTGIFIYSRWEVAHSTSTEVLRASREEQTTALLERERLQVARHEAVVAKMDAEKAELADQVKALRARMESAKEENNELRIFTAWLSDDE